MDEQKFTVPSDRVDIVCAKNAAEVLNEVKMTLCCSFLDVLCSEVTCSVISSNCKVSMADSVINS